MELFLGAFEREWEQRRAALTHDRDLANSKRRQMEEEARHRLRMAKGGGSGNGLGKMGRGGGASSPSPAGSAALARPMAARLEAVASGSQPAVVKMASYGGGARVGAMVNYVSRDGEVTVETETGERLSGREELSRLRDEWSELFQNRNESRDLAGFSVEIEGTEGMVDSVMHEHVRRVLSEGFGDRSYAYAVSRRVDGSIEASGVLVLRDKAGERLTGDAKAAEILQARYDAKGEGRASARFSFTGYGNGVDYGTARLRNLVEAHAGDVRDRDGRGIGNEKIAGDLVQQVWRHELHSRRGRDVMHVIMSARAGTDTAAFERAARDFLGEQFAGYRYAFAVHDPAHDPKDMADGGQRPHVHAHAIVVMRNEAGDRIVTTPQVFREWRAVMAEKAREHGIAMEMTDRREFASAPAYGRNHVRAVNLVGRTEHVGTSEAAQIRYDAKRAGLALVSASPRSVDYANRARLAWEGIASVSADEVVVRFATRTEKALGIAMAQAEDARASAADGFYAVPYYAANLTKLTEIVKDAMEVADMTPAQFRGFEQDVEDALLRSRRAGGEDKRSTMDELEASVRGHVQVMKQYQELQDQRTELVERRKLFELRRDPASGLAKTEFATAPDDRLDASFPDAITRRYFPREDTNGVVRVFTDVEGGREVFQAVGDKLRASTYDANAVRLMVETAAHRGWTVIELAGSDVFRREAWIEGQVRGITVRDYAPTELDRREVDQRERVYLHSETNEQRPASPGPGNGDREHSEVITGVLMGSGLRPHPGNVNNAPSPYVVLRENETDRVIWGLGLPDALYRSGAKEGDRVSLREPGTETLLRPAIKDVGNERMLTEQPVEHRRWQVEIEEPHDRDPPAGSAVPSPAPQTGPDSPSPARDAEAAHRDPPQKQLDRLAELQREHEMRRDRDERER